MLITQQHARELETQMITAAKERAKVTSTKQTCPHFEARDQFLIKVLDKADRQVVHKEHPGEPTHNEVFKEEKLAETVDACSILPRSAEKRFAISTFILSSVRSALIQRPSSLKWSDWRDSGSASVLMMKRSFWPAMLRLGSNGQ